MRPRPRRRPFVDLRSAEIVLPAAPRLFLGRFDELGLRRELEDAGVLLGLRDRGYAEVTILTEYEGGEHRLRIDSAAGGPSLVELRLGEGTTFAKEAFSHEHGPDVLSFLSTHWLCLQDPARSFTSERPRLPGQRYPGLGLTKPIVERILKWARAWGKDGLLSFPEYFHNAVFYSPLFKFLAPVRQGRFEALRRDLALLHVAEASQAIDRRRVIEEPWGAPFQWEPGEMITPLSEPLCRFLDSREYQTAVSRAKDGARFRLR